MYSKSVDSVIENYVFLWKEKTKDEWKHTLNSLPITAEDKEIKSVLDKIIEQCPSPDKYDFKVSIQTVTITYGDYNIK